MISPNAEVRVWCDYPKCEEIINTYFGKTQEMMGKAWIPSSVAQEVQKRGWFCQKGRPVYCPEHTKLMIETFLKVQNCEADCYITM